MKDQEFNREALAKEWLELSEKTKGEFVNPKDVRRMEAITSLLMTEGASEDIKFNFLKGRGGKKGANITKGTSDTRLKYK